MNMMKFLIDKLKIVETTDIKLTIKMKLNKINIDIANEQKKLIVLQKFFNKCQLFLFRVQYFQIPSSELTEKKGNYIKPKCVEMMPLGFLSYTETPNYF